LGASEITQEWSVMKLKKPVPQPVATYLREMGQDPDELLLCTDTDLNYQGDYAPRWLVASPTRIALFAIEGDRAVEERGFDVSQIRSANIDGRVGSAFLQVQLQEGGHEELVRFSYQLSRKFGRVAHKIKQLAEKGGFVITPEDEREERRCPKCGKVKSRHMVVCPRCLSRGAAFKRVILMMVPYWPMAIGAVLIMLLSVGMSLLTPQVIQPFFDDVLTQRPTTLWFQSLIHRVGMTTPLRALLVIVIIRLGLNSIGALMGATSSRLAAVLGTKVTFDLRQVVFDKLQELSVRFHDERSPGALMNRCINDVAGFRDFIWQMTNGILRSLLMLCGAITFMVAVEPRLAMITLIPAPIVFVMTVWFIRHMVPKQRRKADRQDRLVGVLLASLRGIRVVKNFAQEPREADRFTRYNQWDRDAALSVNASQAVFGPTSSFVFGLGLVILTWVGGRDVLRGEMSIGVLLKFIGYMNICYNQLGVLHRLNNWITHLTVVSYRVFEVLDSETEVPESENAREVQIEGDIEIADLTFGYDENRPVLKGVNLKIKKGEMVGLVGHSGSGKTTLVNLISRFYDPQEGSIKIDGTDIREIGKTCLRRQIGVVLQDTQLFRGTIAENIAYGRADAIPEMIMNAAVAAHCHGFITRISDGYDKMLSEGGGGLSGGEKQRVAIARALLYDPKILILDEATSNVDTETEILIQQALSRLMEGRTSLVVAHRLSTVRNVDRILVMHKGRVREEGTHQELLKQRGLYYRLYLLQYRDQEAVGVSRSASAGN
jgi:ATP-binding cassette subfamily B protein